jgi:hypothetical protein
MCLYCVYLFTRNFFCSLLTRPVANLGLYPRGTQLTTDLVLLPACWWWLHLDAHVRRNSMAQRGSQMPVFRISLDRCSGCSKWVLVHSPNKSYFTHESAKFNHDSDLYGSDYEDWCLLGKDAVWHGGCLITFGGTHPIFKIPYCRGAQIPGAGLPEWLKFIMWGLMFVGRKFDACYMSPFWHKEFSGGF